MKKTFVMLAVAATLGACTQAELKSGVTDAVVVGAVLGATCLLVPTC